MSSEEFTQHTPGLSRDHTSLTRAEIAVGSLTRHQLNRSNPVLPTNRASFLSTYTSEPTQQQASDPVSTIVNEVTPHDHVSRIDEAFLQTQQPKLMAKPEPSQVPNQFNIEQKIGPKLPKSNRRRFSVARFRRAIVPVTGLLLIIAVMSGALSLLHWQSIQNNPTSIFADALQNSYSTTGLEKQVTTNTTKRQVAYDFTNMTNPIVSTESTVSMYGSNFEMAAYGSVKNTYFSYTKFPTNISPSITNLATDGWVQLRTNGKLPQGVNTTLADLSDPRYLAIGLLTFGNFPLATRTQLVNYVKDEHIYAFQANRVNHMTLNGTKVLAYPVSININFLKILDQSIALDEGFGPNDVQDAINSLTKWQGAKATFYVSADNHEFVQINLQKAGSYTDISYSDYNTASLPGEPETKLTWPDFAPIQNMIDQQASTHKSVNALNTST